MPERERERKRKKEKQKVKKERKTERKKERQENKKHPFDTEICYRSPIQSYTKPNSTVTVSRRQGSCLQGRGSKQIHNLLAGAWELIAYAFLLVPQYFWEVLLCGFFRPNYLKRFERSSCGCVSPFGFF